jgi:hypothetical protein
MKPLIILALLLHGGALAQNICSLRVFVYDRAGMPEDAPVSVTMDDGRFLGTRLTKTGVAEFCDVGWGTFSITIGPEMCGQVTVKHLYTSWNSTLEVPVIYENCHGFEAFSGCLVLVRVFDGDQTLSEALVRSDNSTSTSRTDRYGRTVFGMKYGTTTTTTVSHPEHKTQTLQISCTRDKPRIEQTIRLRKE